MNKLSVDSYLVDGCGRCEHYQTPQCKVLLWTKPLKALRQIVLAAGLKEEMKWGSPCYSLEGAGNVLLLVSLRDYCAMNFFKGAALSDEENVLESPGPNSRFVRQLRFTSAAQITKRRSEIEGFVKQAIELERAGIKVEVSSEREPMPAELEEKLKGDGKLKAAFAALTPGRQRSHILHIGGAKQTATRETRAQKCAPLILAGRGWGERA